MARQYRKTMVACYLGFVTQAAVNNLAPLLFIVFREQYGLSFEMLGRLILVNFGTQIVSDILTLKYADRVGHRRMAVLAHALCAAGLFCLGVLPRLLPSPYAGLTIAAVAYAAGGGIIEVLMSPIVESLPSREKASAMSLLHSFYCWGQMVVVAATTLLLKALGGGAWQFIPVMWALLPAANAVLFSRVPLVPPAPAEHRTPLRRLLGKKAFLLALAAMLCAGSSELVMSQWASLFAQKGLGVPKVLGDLLGPCLFAATMGVGRALYGVLGRQAHLRRALAASSLLCVLCYALAVFARSPALSLAGCALCGLSVSLMWPGTLSRAAGAFPMGGTAMFGALAVAGDLGASAGPWLTGLVSELAQRAPALENLRLFYGWDTEQLGLKAGLLAGIAFPLVLAAIMLLNRERPLARRRQ